MKCFDAKEGQMQTSKLGSSNPQPKYAELFALVARKELRPARLVTREITLDEVNDTHLAFYSGWPTASSAVTIARRVFEEIGEPK